ncbi:MAG: hypothetical protein R6V62_11515 [Candidatus Fermentibacteraceae bacterium]
MPVLLLAGLLLFMAYSPLLRAFFDPQDFFTIMVPRAAGWSLERYLAEGWIYTESDGTVGGFFRPLSSLLYIPEYELFGTRPIPWMAVSVLIHFTCCAAVGWLALRMGMSRASAVIATLLLAAHPRAVMAVQMVNTRPDVLATLFIVLASGFTVKPGTRPGLRHAVPALLALTAMGFKELGFVSVILLPMLYFAWPRETPERFSALPVLLPVAALLLMFLLRSIVLDYVGGYKVYNPPGVMAANIMLLFGNLTGVSWVVPKAAKIVSGVIVAAFLAVPLLLSDKGWRRLAVLAVGTALLGAQALINFGPVHYEYGACVFFCLLVAASAGEVIKRLRISELALAVFCAIALIPPALLGRRMNERYAESTDVHRTLFEAAGRSFRMIDPSIPWLVELGSVRDEKILPYYLAYFRRSEDLDLRFIAPGTPVEPGAGLIRFDGAELVLTPPQGLREP